MASNEGPELGRGLFGYNRASVNRMISDRDIMLRQAEGRIRAAEARIAELEAQLRRRDDQVTELRKQGAGGGEDREPSDSGDLTSRFLSDELGSILTAAEESAKRLMERVRSSTQQQVVEADRLWRETQNEIGRFATWREHAEPRIRNAQSKIDDIRGKIEDVPERIRRALAPMADAIAALDGDLAEITSAASPPLLVTPTALGSSSQETGGSEPEPRPEFAKPRPAEYGAEAETGMDPGREATSYPEASLHDEPGREEESGTGTEMYLG
jgi:chromosome segregation ATPase